MSTTAALPPLENLLKLSAKRTYAIFATDRDDTLREDEKRYYILLFTIYLFAYYRCQCTRSAVCKNPR